MKYCLQLVEVYTCSVANQNDTYSAMKIDYHLKIAVVIFYYFNAWFIARLTVLQAMQDIIIVAQIYAHKVSQT